MARAFGFALGFVIGLVIFGAVALIFVVKGEHGSIDPSNLDIPSIAKKGATGDPLEGKAVPQVSFEGVIELSPQTAQAIKPSDPIILGITARQTGKKSSIPQVGYIRIENPKFPLHYSLPWDREPTVVRYNSDSLGSYQITATICPSGVRANCYLGDVPSNYGFSVISPKLSGKLANQPIGVPVKLDGGTVIVNRVMQRPDIVECVNAGHSVSGAVQPTASFLAKVGGRARIALVMVPWDTTDIGLPFVSPDPATLKPITRVEMAYAAQAGIGYQALDIAGGNVPFSIKMHKGEALMQTNFIAVVCKAGEADVDCAARFYPALREYALSYGDLGIYRLAPKELRHPVCGDRAVLYLNDWKKSAGTATIDSYRNANPPEVVDGMML